jgi:hypothetical protein
MTGGAAAGGQADRERDASAAICEAESVRAELVAVVQDLAVFVAAIRERADARRPRPEVEGR